MNIRKLLPKLYKQNNNNNDHYIPLQTTTGTNANDGRSEGENEGADEGAMGCLTVTLVMLCVSSLTTVWVMQGRRTWKMSRESEMGMELEGSGWTDECRAFRMPGYLHYDANHTLNNNWVPFDARCPPVSFLKPLVKDLQNPSSTNHALPWLVNRTLVLIGDSIERFHARDFCDILSASTDPPHHPISENGFSPSRSTNSTPSRSFFVSSDYPALKPPPYLFDPSNPAAVPPDWPPHLVQSYRDHHREWAIRDNIRTSPWICEVPKYGFRIITLFGFGLEPYHSGAYYSDQDWFITPASLEAKVEHTLMPLLARLATAWGAAYVKEPDLIEVSSGLWDVRQWSEEDGRGAGVVLDDGVELVYGPLSRARLEWWRVRAERLLRLIHNRFPSNAPILWRALHHPKRHAVAPFSRVQQLDNFALLLLQQLKRNHDDPLAARLKLDDWGPFLPFSFFVDPAHPSCLFV